MPETYTINYNRMEEMLRALLKDYEIENEQLVSGILMTVENNTEMYIEER